MNQEKPLPAKPGWADVPPRDWAEREAYRLAMTIREMRKPHSAQWLSDRTDQVGMRINRPLISDLENGRRRYITTAELAVIAAALSVAPVALLYPGPYDELVEVLPDQPVRQLRAADWFSGLVTGPQDAAGQLDIDNARNMFELKTEREIAGLRAGATRSMSHAAQTDDEDQTAMYRSTAESQLRRADERAEELAARRKARSQDGG